jgi:alkylation response protein AidB-like acyl-CoA dehydrogenase
MIQAADEITEALATSVAEVLQRECPIEAVQRFADGAGGLDVELRLQAAGLGWTGVAAPEQAGGSGMDFAALAVIYEALGAHLSPLPLLGQQLAIEALDALGLTDDSRLAALAAGEEWVAAPPLVQPVPIDGAPSSVSVVQKTWLLADPRMSRTLLPAVDYSGEHFLFLLDGVPADPLDVHDRTRPTAVLRPGRIDLPGDAIIASGARAERIIAALIDHATLALAADAVGGARAALSATVAYLGVRQQFGRPIGSFQALKHRAATMKVRLEGARALLNTAVERRRQGAPDASAFASLAKARACDAFLSIASEAVQLHGGIGFTRECSAQLYLKRAKFSQLLFGDSASRLDRAASLLVTA